MIICDTHIWTEIDLESYVRNYYVHRQVRPVFRWRIPNQIRFQIFKYWIKEKNLVYGWQDDYMWYPHMNRKWFGVICKELLCPYTSYSLLQVTHTNPDQILNFQIFNLEKKPCLWMTGWLYVIHTYEQK